MAGRPIDLARVRAGLARLDEAGRIWPELRSPEAQTRLAEWLAAGGPARPRIAPRRAREAPMRDPMDATRLRLPDAMLRRADALVLRMADAPELAAAGRVTRSHVLREALSRGLRELERKYPATAGEPDAAPKGEAADADGDEDEPAPSGQAAPSDRPPPRPKCIELAETPELYERALLAYVADPRTGPVRAALGCPALQAQHIIDRGMPTLGLPPLREAVAAAEGGSGGRR